MEETDIERNNEVDKDHKERDFLGVQIYLNYRNSLSRVSLNVLLVESA